MWTLHGPAAGEHREDPTYDQRADNGNDQAANVKAGVEVAIDDLAVDESTDDRAQDAEQDVSKPTLGVIGAVDQAGKPTRQGTEDQPKYQTHITSPLLK